MTLLSICKSANRIHRLWTFLSLFIFVFSSPLLLTAQVETTIISKTVLDCSLEVNLEEINHYCDGSEVCFTVENGTLPYNILIDGEQIPPSTDALSFCVDGLSPGFYVITVTDGQGCTASLEVAIPFIDYYLEADITHVSCYGASDGAIQPIIYIDPILFYHWQGPDGFTADTEAVSGLTAGEYHLSVTWPDGTCYFTGSWMVEQPQLINIEVVVEYPECGQPDACLFVSGGTAPYHLWVFETLPPVFEDSPYGVITDWTSLDPNIGIPYDPSTTNTPFCAEDVPNGTYYILVVDSHLCYAWEVVTIEANPSFDRTLEITHAGCNGQGGAICFSIQGGTPPMGTWLSPSITDEVLFGPEGCFDGLAPGTYTITTEDGNGCTLSETVIIEGNGNLNAHFEITSDPCSDQVDGCLYVDGGEIPYHVWVWHWPWVSDELPTVIFDSEGNPVIENAELTDVFDWTTEPNTTPEYIRCAEDIPAGWYLVLVVDANGCYVLLPVHIPEPNDLEASFEITSDDCSDEVDGCLYVNGGSAPYHVWVWHWVSFTDVLPTVVFDDNGNPSIANAQLTNVFNWNETPNDTPEYVRCAEDIPAGWYLVLVVDANGCYVLLPVHIPETNTLEVSFEITSEPCGDQVDGCLYVSGGTFPYHIWIWDWTATSDVVPVVEFDADGNPYISDAALTDVFDWETEPGTTPDYLHCAEDIPAGWYLILVVDANGCYELLPVHIPEPNDLEASFEITSQDCDQVDGCLTVTGGTMPYHLWVWAWNSPLTVIPEVLFDGNGNPYIVGGEPTDVIQWGPGVSPTDTYVRCAEDIPPGYYLVLVIDANGCWVLLPVLIPDTGGFDVHITTTDVSCLGQNDGSIKVEVNGGTPPYTIVLEDMAILSDEGVALFENLYPGTYTITVVDANGCSKSVTVLIGESDGITSNLDFDTYGAYACVDPEGGTPPYTIHWYQLGSNLGWLSNECTYDLEAGAYLVTIFDVNGCSSQDIFFIDEPECAAGEAHVDPEQITSGETTLFFLENYYGTSFQWQFKTDITDWLDIPGATEPVYPTPPIHSGSDKVVYVRAVVECNGEVLISTVAELKVYGNDDLMQLAAGIEDFHLFDPDFRALELAILNDDVSLDTNSPVIYPNPASDFVTVDFGNKLLLETEVRIYHALGAEVFHRQLEPNATSKVEISTVDLVNGIYFINIQNETGREVRKIIVEH